MRRRVDPTLLAVLALLPWAAWAACDRLPLPGRRPTPRIGLVLPFGDADQGGGARQVVDALRGAFDRAGLEVEFVVRDDAAQPTLTAEHVRDLAEEEGVLAIVGGMTSPCALAAAERAEALEVPLITPMATHDGVTRGRRFVFRACFSDSRQGARMARHAFAELGAKRVVVVRDVTNDYSLGLADSFAETFLELGGEVVAERSYRRGIDDGGVLARWLDRTPCDAVYLPLYRTDIVDLVSKSTRLWRDRPLMVLGGDGWHSTLLRAFLRAAPTLPRRIEITAHFAWDDDRPEVRRFVEWWSEQHGGAKPTSAAALGWDTGRLLARALAEPPASPVELRSRIARELVGFDGVTGSFRLDEETGQVVKDVQVLRWAGDDWRIVK